MLARASKRSLPQDVYRQSITCLEGLQLPFLCPAVFKQPKSHRTSSSIIRTPTKLGVEQSRAKTASKGFSLGRNLASAATAEYLPQEDVYIPWEDPTFRGQDRPPGFPEESITSLPTFDPRTSPIILEDSLFTHPRKFRQAKDAIGGNLNDIHQTLHACLQVGRLERAATLVRRLNTIYKADAPGLLAAHNEYVSELTHRIVQDEDQQLLHDLQRWFQVDLINVGVQPNATTYAMMIRASVPFSDAKKDHTFRRYMNLAKEAGLGEDTERQLSLWEDAKSVLAPFLQQQEDNASSETADVVKGPSESGSAELATQVDEVRGVEQKGFGLLTLKKSLSIFPKPLDSNITPVERQKLLEVETVGAAMNRWQEEDAHLKSIGINSSLSNPTIGAMMWNWHQSLVPLIKDDLRRSIEAENKGSRQRADKDSLFWGPHLQSLSAETISAVTILSVMKFCGTDSLDARGVRIIHLVQTIGIGLENEGITAAIRKRKKDKNFHTLMNAMAARSRHRSLANLLSSSASREYDRLEWGPAVRTKVGALLLSHLMGIAKIQASREDPRTGSQVREMQPVFFHTFQYIAGKRVGVVRLNSAMLDLLSKAPGVSALAKYLPMICEPKPWSGYREGGFLEYTVPVVRLSASDSHAKRYALTAADNGDLAQVFAGLDVLSKTPWNINRFVFDTMLEAWNTGEAIAKIPAESPPVETHEEPPPSAGLSERSLWMRRVRGAENIRMGLKSQRCFQNFQLEVARAYLNETFYFPHNCDFRGRAYPMVPFLNHMGADNSRGLLMFAQGKELTSEGLWWLKVHLANVYGYDKASFVERLQFTEAHLPDIRDSVERPLGGSRWWLTAEDPWQCLAACKELKTALDLPDPTKYICKLAIHQDGTCNGLQHYAALGGDIAGAQQVNLEPGNRPSDIYTGVAELVKASIAKDAFKGNGLAKALDGKVTRKVVKQTVMTNVYGVTFAGAKRQVRKQLDDLLINTDFPDTKEINIISASVYIARKIFAALTTIFNGAHDIQFWLTDCAARICESLSPEQITYVEEAANGSHPRLPFKKQTSREGQDQTELKDFKTTVIWTTPLKMPVVQPYRKKSIRRIDTNLQMITIKSPSVAQSIHKAKQIQAFPPNFIHSLDATHMFLTALKCNDAGLTFAAIHDSFWTHAGDVHTMNEIIRDAFIRMHSEDVVGRLAAEFQTRYKDHWHMARVRKDSVVGQKILAWRRLQPKKQEARKWDELILERRRVRLLASDDPNEKNEGHSMVTPGSLFSDLADEKALAPTDVKPAALGLTLSSRTAKLKANQQIDVGNPENAEPIIGNMDDLNSESELEEVFQAEAEAEGEGTEDDIEDEPREKDEVEEESDHMPKRKVAQKYQTWLWLPLNFPPVPKKGDFDVTRLKESKYFFS